MISRISTLLGIAALFLGVLLLGPKAGITQTTTKTLERRAAPYSNPTSGKQMFKDYCAACHGIGGKGDGPAVEFLKAPPSDLTTLAKRHNGKFPSDDFVAVLRFGTSSHPHGTIDMPIWGDTFTSRHTGEAAIRIENLRLYVESMQEK
jgi:mono/diheme cytochrome c family protein